MGRLAAGCLATTLVSGAGTSTLPTVSDTLVGKATSDILTNKTLTSPAINTPTITTPTFSGTAVGPLKILNGTVLTSHATTNQPAIESGTVAVVAGGTTVTFAHAFSANPNVVATVTDGTGACWVAVITAIATNQFTVKVFDKTDAAVAKTIYWYAVGNDS